MDEKLKLTLISNETKTNETGSPDSKQDLIHLRESNPSDAVKLGEFFSSIATQGLIDLKIKRQVDFFSLYRRLQHKFSNSILEDENKEILGTATFIHNELHVSPPVDLSGTAPVTLETDTPTGELISFGCDLRISPQRKAVLHWTKYFLPQLEKLKTSDHIKHFITTINLSSSQAINAFVRTKNKKSKLPVYELLRKFSVATIHGFYPLISDLNPHLKTSYLEKADQEAFFTYLHSKIKNRDLVSISLLSNIEKYFQNSLLYSLSRVVIVKDSQKNIVGCCYPLSSSLIQDYFPQNYNAQAHNFRQFLKLASWLGLARKLTKPFSRTHKEQTLQFQFLNFLNFDHPEVFKALLHFCYKSSKQNEFLVYAFEPANFQYRPPNCTISAEIPYGLYEIRTPDSIEDPHHISLKQKLKRNIWFDDLLF